MGSSALRMGKPLTLKQVCRKGGKVKTKKKAVAARKNGCKGGRPKKPILIRQMTKSELKANSDFCKKWKSSNFKYDSI